MRCIWRGQFIRPPDPADPWGPVGTWFALARQFVPGCRGVEQDAECTLARGRVFLSSFIKDVGPIWA